MRRLASLLALILAACASDAVSTTTTAEFPVDAKALVDSIHADLTTPDRALRSYWRMKTEETRHAELATQRYFRSERYIAFAAQRKRLMAGDGLAAFEENRTSHVPSSFAHEIVEVKPESDSRAIILTRIRNTTPAPAGAVPGEYETKRRRDGIPVRYVMEKDSAGWHVVQTQTTLLDDGAGEWSNHWQSAARYVPAFVDP